MIRRFAALMGIGLILALLLALMWAVHLHRTTSSSDATADSTVVRLR